MKRHLLIGSALLVVLGSGLVHGWWTERWHSSPALGVAVARLGEVPLTIGPWKGEPVDVDPQAVAQANVAGCWMRRYTHGVSGEAVTVLLMCGRAGPVSVHTPEWCYGGAGYEMAGAPTRLALGPVADLPPAQFWTARFAKLAPAVPEQLRIFWAWGAAGAWTAPDRPRLAFARQPVLFKLYVLRSLRSASERLEDDPCVEFMRQLLPQFAGLFDLDPQSASP